MDNFLLSIEPTFNNACFILWKKEELLDINKITIDWKNLKLKNKSDNLNFVWYPILITYYNFSKWQEEDFNELILEPIVKKISSYDGYYKSENLDYWLEDLKVILNNDVLFSQKQQHLIGFILAKFNQDLNFEHVIEDYLWQEWYVETYHLKLEPVWLENNYNTMYQILISIKQWPICEQHAYTSNISFYRALLLGYFVLENIWSKLV